MPIKKYMLHVDGKDHQVSESNIKKYGIDSYAKNYPDATIRMRDDKDSDYDIPIGEYQRAIDSGLHPFTTSYYKDEEEEITERSTFKPDSVAYMTPTTPSGKVQDEGESAVKGQDSAQYVPESVVKGSNNEEKSVVKGSNNKGEASEKVKNVQESINKDSLMNVWDQRIGNRTFVPEESSIASLKPQDSPSVKAESDFSKWEKPNYQDYMNELVREWEGTPTAYPETRREAMDRTAAERTSVVDKIWNDELKGVVDGLIEKGKEEGRAKRDQYNRVIYPDGGVGLSGSAMGVMGQREYAKATDAKKVIDGVQAYLSQKNGSSESPSDKSASGSDPLQEQLMQKVYDYLVQKNTPKSTAEYILRNVFSGSIVGQLLGMADGKSYEQRQIEAGGLQQYQPSTGEEIGAMAASIGADLPVMALTGFAGGAAGNALLKGATNRLIASGLSEAAARGIATRAAQQTAMKWGLRTVSEAVNFGTLEGLGNLVGQVYQTGDVDFGKAATAMAKGAATGAVMGVFGVSNDKLRGLMEGGLGETAGRTLGYVSSLGGRTAILTGSSVFGQYLEDPEFDINNVDWTKEIVHAGLMNIGFDILGAVKKYHAYKKSGIRMRDIEKLNLTKEDIEQLNRIGIEGKDAQELAESILQVKDANELRRGVPEGEGIVGNDFAFFSQELGVSKEGSVLGQLLSHPNVDLSTKAKVAYLMTGMQFRLAPNTNVSEVQEQPDGSYTVEKFNSSGQTNETRRFRSREEAEAYRTNSQNETMPNQVSVLEGMMNDAGKISTATRLFDMVAQQFGVSKEQVAEAYARGRSGETLEGRQRQAYEAIDSMLRSVQSVEDYHYSPTQLKRRMEEGFGKENGWMDKVLKKKYNSLDETERRAYDEYVANMKEILQGNQSERASIGGSEAARGGERADYPLLPGGSGVVDFSGNARNTGFSGEAGNAVEPGNNGAALSPRMRAMESGAALYAERDPAKMRQATVRQRVAYMRLYEAVLGEMTSKDIEALVEADDAGRNALLSTLDANQRRLAEDYLAQSDIVQGMNDALDDAHASEVDAAETLTQKMTSPNGKVIVVALGKHGDQEHEYGVVVSGVDAEGNPTSPEGQIIVVPIASQNWTPDYSSFDESRALSMRIEDARGDVSMLEPDVVAEGMLSDYQADVDLTGLPPIVQGLKTVIADEEGNMANVQVVGVTPDGEWLVLEEGMKEPTPISNFELSRMMDMAEREVVRQEYAELDKAYEREQKEIQRQEERAAQKAREAEEAARIAEEMKKPINRLAKFADGKPDYENSKKEDVREYLIESLGLEGAVKSIRSQRSSLEKQAEEQAEKINTLIREDEENDYGPDQAITARGLIKSEEDKLAAINNSLSFWKDVERITAGPTEEEAQETVNRSVAQQKAAKTKREVYKPSNEYRKMQQEIADSDMALDVLNDLEPHTPEELASQLISGGVRLMKADETVGDTVLKGVQSMTGYGAKDLQRLNFIFATRANGGVSVSEFGEMLELAAKDAGIRFDGTTQEEGVNALLSLLGDVETMGDINRYVERNRMNQARRLYEDEQNAIYDAKDAAAWEEYGMSYADYKKLQDAITDLVEIRQTFTQDFWESDEYVDFISNFAGNRSDNGQEGNDIQGSGSSIGENSEDDGRGNEVSSGGNQESTGGVQPSVEVAAGREPNPEVQEAGTENRPSNDVGDGSAVLDGQGDRSDEGRTEGSGTETAGLVSAEGTAGERGYEGSYSIKPAQYTTKKGKVLDMYLVKFDQEHFKNFLSWDVVKKEASELRGWKDRKQGGYLMRSREDAQRLADFAVIRAEMDAADAESLRKDIEKAREEVNTSPTEAQKEAGNYKMGHVKLDGYDITIENPKGSVRSGKDANGKEWRTTMNNDYGYIRGTKAVDGDHIDVFLSDNPEEGRVFVVDQTHADGSFDESKVMYGFNSLDEAREAYLSNYDAGWENRIMAITEVSKEEFKKWIDSSTRKTKAFSEYKSVKQGNELKPTYDEQGRETIESQAGHSRGEAGRLAGETEPGSVEDEAATGRGSGTGGNRPVESAGRSGKPETVNGFRIGEKVLYKGKEATIYDFENDGTPVLDTGMAPVIYEVGYWDNIQKMPTTVEQITRIADAQKPAKKLERAEQRKKRNQPKREKQKEQMADLFAQVDAMEEKLARQEQEIDVQLALLGEYKAGPKAQVREDMHTGAAKTLEKAGRKFAKNLASRLGGHVDGKELSRGITNIAPIGGDMVFRVWMDDAETQGVMVLINFDTAPDTDAFDKLVPKYGFWRMISDKDVSGVRNANHNFDLSNIKELESGATMTKVADAILKELNREAGKVTSEITSGITSVAANKETNNVVLTENERKDGREERNQAENPRMGTEARQEAERTEPTGVSGSSDGHYVSDTKGSGRVSERDGEQQPSVNEPSPVASSVKRNTHNWSYGETHLELPSGEIGKLKGNIEAIRTLKELEASGQPATPEQKQALLKFVGWGGLAEALNSAEYAEWQQKVKSARHWGWNEASAATAWSKKWGKHYEDLRPLMTDEEWATAQASTLNSHYTPETVIRGLWEALEYMGFKGGSILEPAMGVGHILGFMPKDISERSVISGFELDSIPGRIAKQLYPDADIHVAGYETAFRPGSKDAVVTNVPFGQTAPVDPALDKALRKKLGSSYNLHNYFIIKGLLELRQGGVGAFITSSATMDGRNTKAREYISSLGVDLVGAIRLPNNTFKSNAGTEVTADILFFRKRLTGESTNGIGFTSLTQVGIGKNKVTDKKDKEKLVDVPLFVNEYFAERPEMMLGTVMTAHDAGSGGLYGGDNLTLVARPGTELSAELADAIGLLPENVFEKGTVSGKAAVPGETTTQKDGTLSVKDGKVYVASKGELTEVASGSFKHNGKTRSYADATTEYQAMKETLKELIQAEQTQAEDPVELRKKLNEQYDRFVEKYGRLNENKNLNVVMDEDPERFLPQALEKVETVTNPTTGRRTKVVSKGTGILAQRVSQPMTEPTSAESLGDAIGISQAYRGRMDVEYIGRMLGISTDEARERILTEREAYEDPVTGDLVDRDAYLSGNIREKLDAARAAAENDSRYETNVADLEKAMPESIPFVDIFYKMGTPWIPEDVYESFAEEVVGLSNVEVSYTPVIDQFVVNKGRVSDYTKSNSFTTTRRDALQVFEDAINLRKPTIMKTVYVNGEERTVKDEQATQEAIQAIMDMNDAFIQYIQEAKQLHARLTNIYNDRYNNYRLREYREPAFKGEDGKVHYPNANPGITLRTHQVKAVQRSLIGSTLLAHQVGTGKTFTMITTAMEMRRLGIAKKPMIVVQNATLQDFAADFMKLYPSAKILVPNETERSASQRKRLFNLIATGDFDAIIVPQSFLAFIPDDEGRKKAMIQARVDEIMNAAESLQFTDKRLADKLKREAESLSLSLSGEEKGGKKKNVKKEAKKEESALVRETRKFDRKTDDVLTFEQMGVDALFIDEAHNYKKIGFTTKMQNVKGVDTGYSERANSLYLKVSYVQEKNGGRNVVLATGTPITNTMAEVWTMMRFVAPEILEDYGIRTFDEFAATFGQVEPSLEQNSTGGFKIADRFKSYVNVPELVKAFRSHADVVLTTDVEEFKESKNIPKLKDGQMTNHVIQKSDKLQEVMDVLINALAEDEKKSGKEKTPGLPLVVFSKAKQAAIDLRLINPEYPDDPNSKTNKVVSEVMRIYKESTPDKGIQMIFCDSYQSPASAPAIDLFDYDPDVPQFNLYRDIKNKLVKAGIPKDEIVIVSEITNAERKKAVFEKARAGVVRVLIGGTEKMGVGVNVQDRMIALHHMDAPIRPMDFEQRNGRILRQGNMFAGMDKPVEVLTYGVEGTLDATAYERLRIKQDFINQMMKGDVSGRVMEESDDEDPSGKTFSQMAAELSGDKTLQLLFVAENKVKRFEGLRRSHEMKREAARVEAAMLKSDISRLKSKLKDAERMGEEIAKRFPEGVTKLTINGRPVTEKLSKVLAETLEEYEERYALNRSVVFPVIELNDKAAKMVFGHDAGQLNYSLFVDKFQLVDEKPINTYAGAWLSLNSALSNSGKRAAEIRETIAKDEARIKGAESIQEKDFDKMDELKQYRAEVKKLKEELAKKAEKPVPGAEEVKLAKKNLKSGEKPVSLPEEMAGDSEESLDRMETAMKPYVEVAVNAPETVVAMGASDILKAMPDVSTMQFASIVKEASRPEVQAMYVPWTRQIIMLPKHGTVKEMRDKRWHESFHFGIDMVLPQGDEGRLMLERAASEADKLVPALTKWVEDTYGNRNTAEEKVVHVLEEVVSYMEDAGRVKALRGGLDFGSQYPVLNDVANRIINYLTNNGNGKESDDYSGYDEGNQPAGRREDQGWGNEEDFAGVRGSETTKAERIEKLRNSRPIVAEWKDYEGRYELNKESAEKYILNSLRGDYTNKDTGEKIKISRKSVKVMHHDVEDEVHLKSVALIPEMLEESVFIEEVKNEKEGGKFDSYRYYVVGLKLDGVDYTAKLVVGVKGGDVYYDHALTQIEKSDIINQIDLVNAQVYDDNTALSDIKDKRLISILQTNGQENEENLRLGLRGKPRRKAGESLISYNRRLKEWQQEVDEAKRTREVENMDVENPLDTELNDLAMEMMNHPSPIRKRGESEEDFNARHAEWSEWYNTRRPEIERRIAEIKVLLTDEKHAARVKEMKRVDEHLYDGTIPDQKDDEGQLSDEEMREVREIFQEKMQDAKIAVDRDQMKRDIKQEIIERRRKIETSNLEDTFFVEDVKKAAGYNKDILKAIPDYIEGTYTGEETPELVKASKLVSDWFEDVYNIMAREGVLYDAKKIQNYVTHIWDWNASSEEAQKAYREAIRLRSPFTKHRVIPTYKMGIAMGMVPKYDDITGIILEYGHRATETIENKRLLNFLRGFKVYVPANKDNMPMYVDLIVEDKVKDPLYKKVSNEAFDGYKIVGSYIKYISPVFGRQRIFDHSEEENNPIDKLSNFFWGTSALLKKVQLSFSFFHHGALTETAIAMMGPVKAGKVIGKDVVWDSILKGGTKALGRVLKRGKFTKTLAKNLMWDIIQKGELPAMNDKEAARDAVNHLVSIGATNDYIAADAHAITTKLKKFIKQTEKEVSEEMDSPVNMAFLKNVSEFVDKLNKGSDKLLWDVLHDGFKIASFSYLAKEVRRQAEREGWDEIILERALDECGHLINDTFGGLHFDLLGQSPVFVRVLRAFFLSPDWNLASLRQAISPFGFGRLYGDKAFWEGIGGESAIKTRKKYGRSFWWTAGWFFATLITGLNVWLRLKDEEDQKEEAEEKRKVDPDYKSPYEIAYPDGMKWYDYTMLGNALGHKTHLFGGRYADGTEIYIRWGKQFRELPELFFGRDGLSFPGPIIDKLAGKINPFVDLSIGLMSGHSLSGWAHKAMENKIGIEKEAGRLYLIAEKLHPFSFNLQPGKEWMPTDIMMPSSKGFSVGKAIREYEKALNAGDFEYLQTVYDACVMNKLNPNRPLEVAGARLEAEAKANMIEGIENVQDAVRRFEKSDNIKERKRLLRYIEQQIGAQDFNAISREEIVQKAKDIISGEDAGVEASDVYLGLANEDDIMQDIRMKMNAAGLKKYYQDYTELMTSQPEVGRRMLNEKRKFIEGYTLTTKCRTAINRIKKAMLDGRINEEQGMKEIRRLRSEYFDRMNNMELE